MDHNEDPQARAFMRCGAELIKSCVAAVRAEDPEAAGGLTAYLHAGGVVSATFELSPARGVGELRISVVDSAGQPRTLRALNVRRVPDA